MAGPIRIAILANGKQARAELQQTGIAATGLGKTVGKVAKGMGLAWAGIELAKGAGELLKQAGEFQKSTTLLVTAGGESQRAIAGVSDGILKLAGQTGTSASDLSEGMYLIEKAGYRAAAGLEVLKNSAEGAKAENVDMATETQAVTSIMTSYHEKASDSAKVVNELVAASGAAKVTMQEFAGSLATILPSASAAHLSFAEIGGAIATLTQHGTSAAEATVELAFAVRNLQAPNNVASKEMQQLGLNVSDVSKNLGKRGLTGTLDLVVGAITKHMGKAGLVLLDAFKKSQSAGQDLQIMLHKMPPDLAQLSHQFLKGTIGAKEYSQGFKGMNAEGNAMGSQFLSLTKTSMGFNELLKSGNPSAQTFTDALKKVMGGAVGMNTALQLSGENMAGFKTRVDEVNKAADEGGNKVTTWAQTQKTFSVEVDRVKNSLQALGIRLFLPALPGLAKGFGDLADGVGNAAPAVSNLLGVLQPAVQVFKLGAEAIGAMPGPLKTLALEAGIAALVFPRLSRGVIGVGNYFQTGVARAKQFAAEMTYMRTETALSEGAMTRLRGSMASLAGTGGMVALTAGASSGNKAVSALGGALTGAALGAGIGTEAFPLLGTAVGGILGAVGGLALAMHHSSSNTDDATSATARMNRELARKQAIQQRQSYIDQLITTLDQLTGATTRATRRTVFQNLLGSDGGRAAIKNLQKLGFTQGQITDIATNRNSAAAKSYDAVNAKVARYSALYQKYASYISAVSSGNPSAVGFQLSKGQMSQLNQLSSWAAKQGFNLNTLQAMTRVINGQVGSVGRSQEKWKQLQLGVRKYIGTLKGLPTDVATHFRTTGGKGTLRDAEQIARKYHVVNGTTARLILKAEGLPTAQRSVNALIRTASGAKPKLDKAGTDAGAGLTKNTSAGIDKGKGKVDNSLRILMGSALTVATSKARAGGPAAGSALSSGVAAGIRNGQSPVNAAATGLINGALTAMHRAADAHSPSRKTIALAGYMVDGLRLPLRGRQRQLQQDGRNATTAVLRGMRDGIRTSSSANLYARQRQQAATRNAALTRNTGPSMPGRVTLRVGEREFTAYLEGHVEAGAREQINAESAFWTYQGVGDDG